MTFVTSKVDEIIASTASVGVQDSIVPGRVGPNDKDTAG
jgi:hypothetical protein